MLNGYVKQTSNSDSLDLGWDRDITVIEELGSHTNARVHVGADRKVRTVVGWTDLFGGSATTISAYRAEWHGAAGILLCGGNSGVRILANEGEAGDGNAHLTPGWGMPVMWIEAEDDLVGFDHVEA